MHTTLSLPSMLNIAHLTDLTTEVGPYTADPAVPNYLVENNRTLAFLQSQGYRFIFFPSQWWLATRHNRHADLEFHAWTRISSRELSHSELRRNLRLLSVLDQLHDDLSDDFNHLTRTFEALSQVPQHDSDAPIFAFAHIMKPHHPFAFDRECRPRRRHVFHHAPATSADQGYVVQLKCLNRLVLQLVDSLLRTSAVSPVILIQGDHGTKTLGASTARSTEAISPAAAPEHFGAFGAYYLPDGGAAEFGDSVTVVNVLGNVLRYYFGADVPRQREALYMSVTKRPYDFQQVDPEWLTGGDALAPLSRASH